jgi:hypothetical protein
MATTLSSFDKLIADLQKQQESANLANQKRYDEMLAIYDEVIRRYQPGGSFEKAGLEQLGQQKTRDIGAETQQMIGSGLYGTTTTASLPSRWEQETGAPSRLKLEDIMMQRLSQAQIGKAGAIENVSDTGPSYDLIAQLAMQRGQGTVGGTTAPTGNNTWSNYRPLSEFMNQMTSDMGGGGSTYTPRTETDFSRQNTLIAQREKEMADYRAKQSTTSTPSGTSTTKSLIGQPVPLGAGTQQSVFDTPPTWTGNYQTWKTAMDQYNKAHGLSLQGY